MKGILQIYASIFLICALANTANAFDWDERTYNNNKYVSIKNLKDFYGFPAMEEKGKNITLRNSAVRVEFTVDSHHLFMNNVKFILSNPVALLRGKAMVSQTDLFKLIDPIMRPNYIRDNGDFNTVIIDPGHGGKDPGAVNRLGTEAYYNLKVAKMVASYLRKAKFNVVMTRQGDKFLSLSERVKLANKYKNAIFISIHFNAGGAGQAQGFETFTLSPRGVAHHGRGVRASDYRMLQGNHQDSQNIALATAVHGSSINRIKIFDRGIKRARYSVLTSIKHPAILVEGGFMSHSTEARKIHTFAYQNKLAQGIAAGILKYKKALSRTASHQVR